MEVGAGHGLFCRAALKNNAWTFYDVVDISETSINLSKAVLSDYAFSRNLQFLQEDYLDMDELMYETIVIGEVLEHVENPVDFIKKSRRMISPNGRVYVSTCLNAPEPDHIFLFSTINEVEKIFAESNFAIEQVLHLPYEGRSVEECVKNELPVNLAYILRPR